VGGAGRATSGRPRAGVVRQLGCGHVASIRMASGAVLYWAELDRNGQGELSYHDQAIRSGRVGDKIGVGEQTVRAFEPRVIAT